eukprot:TRINITY_DN5972_c0_g1_i1.p1 TRINITY_DN5972_c0_g1~~TRINITY_DN5972_c0_g1_i1.p1  ORF type:complete len:114 (-),score=20.01 TRINITY_DN5972_c0_g1_i1:46-387(-)
MSGKSPFSLLKVRGKGPTARSGHVACFYDNAMFTFGGSSTDCCFNDVFKLAASGLMSWGSPDIKGSVPDPRHGHAAALVDSKWFMFFGKDENGDLKEDVTVLDVKKMTWMRPR